MRKTLGVCLFVLLLTAPAVAGEMPNGSPDPLPPASADGIMQGGDPAPMSEDGIMHGDNADTLTQFVLTVLASILP